MKPEWKKACEQFRQQYKCKNNDVSERTVIANVDDKGIQYLHKVFHKIEGTPTIMYMSNKNNKHVMREYSGKNAKRTSAHFLKWLHSSLGESVFSPNLNMKTNKNTNQIMQSGGSRRRAVIRGGKNRNRGSTTRRRR
jgi:hypothetical protein